MDQTNHSIPLTRRRLLAVSATGVLTATAGCLGSDDDVPDPIALDDGQICDNCDMQIETHPGPVGQAFYIDDTPDEISEDREDGVAHFCSSYCTYMFVRENEEQEYEPAGIYTTDYSEIEYDLREDAGATVISSHLAAEDFARVEELTYTVDSDVEGAMGPSLIGFSDSDDAAAFQDEHGGMNLEDDDMTLETVGSL